MFGTVTVLATAGQFTLMWRDSIVAQSEYRADATEVNASEFAADYGVALDFAWTLQFTGGMVGWNGKVVENDSFALALLKRHQTNGNTFGGYFECEHSEPCPFLN